ncbi:inorganic phosphate transporter [Dolichospermum sp. ST_sed1]|nr:inorganic phosphate transporter [Dolichospermum sp. ST_sed1]MDD1423856.1 inorganic phosphate transporter [Dolichospermum sp. ST_sed9]MDD1429673.1 inorganic phosphate transporter [Dolichospermum sp. ST_sed6]MDD1439296.1 inorganic phosphate transporter [Dolichospermum sp. ST_sed3]MDD1445078.1 inorganic phosphate transporter [Dolichospermum sp. ST_sed8]MDD1455494.1 inorganic phosphate transporter [Dolichospermum sp. ST_sed7]MDD1459280.1 inorganic phosphate transporter [Dolichospermum sp. ST_s
MEIQTAIVAFLAFYVAWNLGANDVANAMGTSVGSKAITLKQAIIIAGVLEFLGAVLFGQEVTSTLSTKIVNPALFATTPQTLVMGMIAVLISGGVWLQIATARGLPVSSSHAIVGAIAGFSWVALGVGAIDWSSIGLITIGWILTPIISGAIAAGFYSLIQHWIFNQPHPLNQLQEWIPWLSTMLLSVFGIIILPTLTQPLSLFLRERGFNIPPHDITLFTGGIAVISLTLISWRQLADSQIEPKIQGLFAKFQVLSACFVAFAHGSNDVGNAIAPLAVISYINQHGAVPSHQLTIPLWILVLGAVGIVAGLAVWGKKVIATIGENIISLEPSSGFCAELATAVTILLASRLGLPVSTSHALVGGVVGIGLVQQNIKSIKFSTIQNIAAAWLITVPISAALSAAIFKIMATFWH